MHALLAALALTAIPSRAAAADDPLALTLAATSGGCRGDEQGAASLVCASRKAQGAVEALELFRARAASAEDRNKAAALVAPELAPFFRDRDSALDALYRTLAVLDDSRVLAAGNDSCSARARRAVLLGSSDGLFTDPRTGRSSAWLTRLLGAQAAERSAASALDAAAGTPLADADYERLRARARELSRRILQNGADRSALCERARAYTALASAHRFARLTPAGRETSAATDPAASVLLLVRLRAGGYDALGAAVAVDGPRGPRLLTDARLVLDPATGHALTDLATVRLDAGKLSAPAPWTPARTDASAGLAEGPVPDGVPALALAEGAPRERDLVSAIGQSGASSLWGRTQGLVSRVGGDWFATDAAVDVGMTGAAVLNADGRLTGVLVLRAARTTDERRLDWPAAVSAPALRRWLSGDALAAPAGPLDVAGLGTASIAGGAFIDASTSWNEGCGGVGTYIPELNQTIHATCAADCDCSSPSPSPQPSSPAPQAAPSAPAGPDYAQQFGAQMGQMMGQYLGNMIGQALFGGGGAAAAPPQAPVPVPRAPSPPPKSERPQDERKIIGLKLTLDPPDPQPGQTATLTAQLLFNGDDYEDKANVDIELTVTGESRFLDPMADADDEGAKSVNLQTDTEGKAVVKLKFGTGTDIQGVADTKDGRFKDRLVLNTSVSSRAARLVIEANSSAIAVNTLTLITARIIADDPGIRIAGREVSFTLKTPDGEKTTIKAATGKDGSAQIALTLAIIDDSTQLAGREINAGLPNGCLLFGTIGSIVVEATVIVASDGTALLVLTPSLSVGNGAASAGACLMLANAANLVKESRETLEPPGDCTKEEHAALQADVNDNCHGTKSCARLTKDDCEEILARAEKFSACIAARNKINGKCFRGGNKVHREDALESAVNALIICQERARGFGCYESQKDTQ